MIDPSLYLGFIAAVTVLMLIPGPNVALIVANSVAHGPRYGLLTVAGTSAAMGLQLALVALGMTQFLGILGGGFGLLRWIGVAYSLSRYRAVACAAGRPHQNQATAEIASGDVHPRPAGLDDQSEDAAFLRRLLPQFVSPGYGFGPQVVLLSATFVATAVLVDGSWALAAARARHLLATRGRLRNRIAGGMLIGAGAVLAAARHR
jgi:threonine/homoserine/homoserine lactone efflux protein